MKQWTTAAIALLGFGSVLAQEVGRVITSTPVVQAVVVPRQVCTMEQISFQGPNSGAGALLGAMAGGALGNAAGGHGAGRAAATVIGMVGGAVLGDRVEGPAPERVENVQRCSTQNFYENRTVGYNVVYEFAGRQYAVQMPNDPGPSIAIQITPVGSLPEQPRVELLMQSAPTSYISVQPVRRYYVPNYYPSVVIPFGFYGRHEGHGRRHW